MWTELSFLVMSLLVWNFLSSNLCYSDCLFFLFTSNCGHVFSSQYPPTSLPFQYPCWVWDTRTHHNWDNEVTSWTEVLSSCWTIIPISTSFPLGWLNFKAGWVFPVPEENLTRVSVWLRLCIPCAGLCETQTVLLWPREQSRWECLGCASSGL